MKLDPGSYIYPHPEEALDVSCALFAIPRERLHTHPDIHIIKGEGSIGIDTIREAGRYLRIKPAMASYKFLFIENFHLATEEAQNAFLKTFEEPPEYAYIFLITPYIDRLLKTVVSRAQVITNHESRITNHKFQFSSFKFQELIEMNVAERLLYLDEMQKGIENKNELRRALLSLIDNLLLEAVELGKEKKFHLGTINALKEAKWKIEQGFPNPKLLIEDVLLTL